MSAYNNWRYDSDELPDDVTQASTALENLQLDRKARSLTSSWRFVIMHSDTILLLLLLKAFESKTLSPFP